MVHTGGVPDSHPPDDLDSLMAERQRRIKAAIRSAKRGMRGLPLEQAEAQLLDELRRQDVSLPAPVVRFHAQQYRLPWWRRPLSAGRHFREAEPGTR